MSATRDPETDQVAPVCVALVKIEPPAVPWRIRFRELAADPFLRGIAEDRPQKELARPFRVEPPAPPIAVRLGSFASCVTLHMGGKKTEIADGPDQRERVAQAIAAYIESVHRPGERTIIIHSGDKQIQVEVCNAAREQVLLGQLESESAMRASWMGYDIREQIVSPGRIELKPAEQMMIKPLPRIDIDQEAWAKFMEAKPARRPTGKGAQRRMSKPWAGRKR